MNAQLPLALAGSMASMAHEQSIVHKILAAEPGPGKAPRFQMTYCSQCGCECGPGDSGFSDCRDHCAPAVPAFLRNAL